MLSLDELVSEGKAILDIDETRTTEQEVSERLIGYLKRAGFKAFGTKLSRANIWHRARVQRPPEVIKNSLFELIYSEAPSKSFGRLNMPGSRVLYN